MDALLLRDNSGIQIDAAIRARFPAVFNDSRSVRTTEKYQIYPSFQIIEQMQEQGLRLVELAQQRSSKRSPLHTQHVMRFQPSIAPEAFGVADSVPEVVIMNSHDGKGRFRAYAGVFRFVCDNGMVVATELLGSTVRRHFGKPNTFEQVMEVVAQLPETVNSVSERIQAWAQLQLNTAEQQALAAVMIRDRKAPEWVSPELALEVHRPEDEVASDGTRSLWNTFNVLQENLTTRQLARPAGRTEGRQSPLRPLSGAVMGVEYNRRIWTQAEAYFQAAQDAPSSAKRVVDFFRAQAEMAKEGDERQAVRRMGDIYRMRARRLDAKVAQDA